MLVYVYAVYLVLSIAITVWVGRTLHSNGRVFLVQNFQGNEALADSINHLLLVGFYLINFGFMSLTLKYGEKPADLAGSIEFLSTKIGAIIMVLGVMHFFNMRALIRFRHAKFFDSAPAAPKPAAMKQEDPAWTA
ncbi:MAG: hypothetical protein PW788_02230 [Micavibrio sp.]|nr:hypothetical protein [Micavibrio sp.]